MLIYVADDNPDTLSQIEGVLTKSFKNRSTVAKYATCNGVLSAIEHKTPGILIMDLCMEGGYQKDLERAAAGASMSFRVIREAVGKGVKVIVLTNLDKDDALAQEYGVHAWLNKFQHLDKNHGLGLVRCVQGILPPQ